MPSPQIGQIMVGRCLLTQAQVDELLKLQATDSRPLGEIAADYFGLPVEQICDALADQINSDCPRINLSHETIDPNCLQVVAVANARASIVLPMRVEQGVLICATTVETLSHAIRLMQDRTAIPVRFMIAPIRQVEQHISQLYDDEGVDVA